MPENRNAHNQRGFLAVSISPVASLLLILAAGAFSQDFFLGDLDNLVKERKIKDFEENKEQLCSSVDTRVNTEECCALQDEAGNAETAQ